MSLTNMKVFNEYVMPVVLETLAQEYDKFNAASGGAIRLNADGFVGDYHQESFYSTLAAAQRRVDRYAANGAATATPLAQLQKNMVKVGGGIGPVLYEPSQMSWLEKPTAEGIAVASSAFAAIIMQDQLNTAIAAAVAAIGNVSGLVNDVSASADVSYSAMNDAHALFGDRSTALKVSVMNGATYHRLIGQNLTNTERLFEADGVLIVDILGKAVVVTDAPALADASDDKILSLVPGGIEVNGASDIISNIDTTNGKERIETTLQVDYSFGLGIKGFSWDTANGGASPTDAELATGTNWDQVVTSVKDTAGVLTVGAR